MGQIVNLEDFREKSLPGEAESLGQAAQRLLESLNRKKEISDLANDRFNEYISPEYHTARRIPGLEQS